MLIIKEEARFPDPYLDEVGIHAPCHPSIVYLEKPWNGFSYWLAYTPYPNGNSDYENPCVVYSRDGITWESAGIKNPVGAPPERPGYNADPHLFFNSDLSKLCMVHRLRSWKNGVNQIIYQDSENGLEWSNPIVIHQEPIDQLASDTASPSMFYDKDSNKFYLFINYVCQDKNLWHIKKYVTADHVPTSELKLVGNITLNLPADRYPWHSFFMKSNENKIIGFLQDSTGICGKTGNLYFLDPLSELSFNCTLIADEEKFYRSSFAQMPNNEIKAWVGIGTNRVFTASLET